MIRRLLNSNVAALRVSAARLALIAGLAWCVAIGAARADEPSLSESREILLASFRDGIASSDFGTDDLDNDDLTPDCIVTDSTLATPDRLQAPLLDSASSVPQSLVSENSSAWSWVPQGMVPYWGPRTPDSEKDRGIGGPLPGSGWRNNPFEISGFAGMTAGGALISGHVLQQPSAYGGFNVGWDYDHYWGIEKRLGFGALNLTNAHHDPIHGDNLSITGEYRLMYYPLGDARWRPFVTTGLGWSDFYFQDDVGDQHLDTVGMVPFGLGVKYLHREHIALRIDVIDELTIGAGSLSTFHYVALTAGLEVRYGRRLLKMPWHKANADHN